PTHGFFRPDVLRLTTSRVGPAPLLEVSAAAPPLETSPMLRSGLVLAGANRSEADGIVTAAELANLDLRGTQLVVLSACETGVGDVRNGDGVIGLRRALVLAGARAQLVSL